MWRRTCKDGKLEPHHLLRSKCELSRRCRSSLDWEKSWWAFFASDLNPTHLIIRKASPCSCTCSCISWCRSYSHFETSLTSKSRNTEHAKFSARDSLSHVVDGNTLDQSLSMSFCWLKKEYVLKSIKIQIHFEDLVFKLQVVYSQSAPVCFLLNFNALSYEDRVLNVKLRTDA